MIAILLPVLTALIFIGVGSGWLLAILRPHSWLSQRWYGREWLDHFTPLRQSNTRLRAWGFAGFYLLLGLVFLLMGLQRVYPVIATLASPLEIILLLAGIVWMGAALIIARQQQKG